MEIGIDPVAFTISSLEEEGGDGEGRIATQRRLRETEKRVTVDRGKR